MPIVRPSYNAIFSSLYTDISSGIGNAPIARFSILGALGRALARALDAAYGYVDASFRDAIPWSATGTALDAWGALWGVTRLPPAAASGSVLMVFTGAATIPVGATFTGLNGVTYVADGADVVAVGPSTLAVSLSTTTTGTLTNLDIGAIITMATPIANVNSAGTIFDMTGGQDAETDRNLFARTQEARSSPPQGGAVGDMKEWALASNSNITRAWVPLTPAQPGLVVVYICLDGNSDPHGFPVGTNGTSQYDTRGTAATGDQLLVADYIYANNRRPVTAFVQVVSPIATPINITLTNCNPNTIASTAAVTAALNARFVTIGSPLGQNIYESDITVALNSVLTSYTMTVPTALTAIPIGHLPTLGTLAMS